MTDEQLDHLMAMTLVRSRLMRNVDTARVKLYAMEREEQLADQPREEHREARKAIFRVAAELEALKQQMRTLDDAYTKALEEVFPDVFDLRKAK